MYGEHIRNLCSTLSIVVVVGPFFFWFKHLFIKFVWLTNQTRLHQPLIHNNNNNRCFASSSLLPFLFSSEYQFKSYLQTLDIQFCLRKQKYWTRDLFFKFYTEKYLNFMKHSNTNPYIIVNCNCTLQSIQLFKRILV